MAYARRWREEGKSLLAISAAIGFSEQTLKNHYFNDDQMDVILVQFYGTKKVKKTSESESGKLEKLYDAR